ncbi:penicillin-binding protein 2 [Desulfosarcina sp. OttesenSCG-928-A07]|nr:penicillin-binding protein 2 [Desulfosarcina sp. OttesenSCG-928-A07]
MSAYSDIRLHRRASIVGVLFILMLIVIMTQAIRVHVVKGPWLSERASREYERAQVIQGKRGSLRDRNGNPLAVSIDGLSVAAYPRRIAEPEKIIPKLAVALEKPEKAIQADLNSNRKFVWLSRKVTPRHVEAVRSLEVEGIDFIGEHGRLYPNKTLAAQLVGFSGDDGHGLEGLEFFFNAELAGRKQSITFMRDALGRRFEGERSEDPLIRGNDVILTIDTTIQYIAQKALKSSVAEYRAKSGIAIVMVPTTGEILAMAHEPVFNPNQYREADRSVWRNRAVTDLFEPGSTLKIFSTAAALDSDSCSAETTFFCENGKYRIGNHTISDTKPHGWLSVQEIVKYSSNIGTVKMAQQLGAKKLYAYLSGFGFGERTNVTCPGEAHGSLSPYRSWTTMDMSAISFGHGISVTAIQLITAASAIANNGMLMKPQLVRAVVAPNGEVLRTGAPEPVRQVISPHTAALMREILETVIAKGGTGANAALKGYRVCGKTGTARKLDSTGAYSRDTHIASFVGFAPAERPEIAILVIVDEPVRMHYGGAVAAPAFKQIAVETLSYLNIPPGYDTNLLRVSHDGGIER